MFTKKVGRTRTRSNNIDNTTTGVGLNIAGLANSTYHDPSSYPQLMFQRKRAINLNHLYSYQTEAGSVPSVSGLVRPAERSLVLDHFGFDHPSESQSVRFAGKSTNSKLLDSDISAIRLAERSIELNVLHSYHSDYQLQLNSSMCSVRPAERSIESNVLHSYHSHPSALRFAQNSTNPSMSDVRSAERSIELNQWHSFHFEPTAYQLHTAGLTESSIYSKVLDSDYPAAQIGTFDLSTSDVRSAERSLVL